MIRATGLSKRFGDARVLDGVDLTVRQGERVALLGLNGAGKTTLMRCLLGLIPFDGGLAVAGLDVRTRGREVRSRLGYVPQRAPHFDGTLEEIVDFFARLRGADPAAVAGGLASLGLDLAEHGRKPVRTLSGGMLQKVLLALALGADVPLLLLDEPTANLDPRARLEFLRALKQVGADTTVLLASHRLTDVAAVADRLLVLHGGAIAFDGSLTDLWRRVGAAQTLWVKLPTGHRDAARRYLEERCRLTALRGNGAALGVKVEHHARADVLVELRGAGFTVEDFWTETPSLHDLLENAMRPPEGA
jgi:ABC-type multidrug transport system ATPase subunit